MQVSVLKCREIRKKKVNKCPNQTTTCLDSADSLKIPDFLYFMLKKFHTPCFSLLSLLSFLSSFIFSFFKPQGPTHLSVFVTLRIRAKDEGTQEWKCWLLVSALLHIRLTAASTEQCWHLPTVLGLGFITPNKQLQWASGNQWHYRGNLFAKPNPSLSKPGRGMGKDYHRQLMLIPRRNQPPGSKACTSPSTGRCLSFSQWCLYPCSLLLCYWEQR